MAYREGMDIFLGEIKKYERPSPEEELDLIKRAQAGDIDARNELVTRHIRFIVSFSKRFQNRGLQLTDLIQEAAEGMIQSVRKFDHTRGVKFISYSVWWMRQRILAAIEKQGHIIRQPLNLVLKRSQIRTFTDSYFKREGCNPSAAVIAKECDVSESDVHTVFMQDVVSLDEDLPNQKNNDATLYSVVSDDATSVDDEVADTDLVTQIMRQIDELEKIGYITKREKDIFLRRVGIYNRGVTETLEEIADEYGVTRERVRQLFERTQKKIQKRFQPKRREYGYAP